MADPKAPELPFGSSDHGKSFLNRRISHFDIVEVLGEGGMGIVFKARDAHLDRPVALKMLRPECIANPQQKQRFVFEAKAASALNHPNIVHIYEIGSEGGVDFIAMEFVAGVPLNRMLARKRLDWREAVRYGAQIADSLDAAHTASILHRDLKPGNVIINDRNQAKVLDFGIAKLIGDDQPLDPDLDETRTSSGVKTGTGLALGTPAYMSPEQARGQVQDARSDIFALGIMLYQMVTGELPFRGGASLAVIASILRDEPQSPSLLRHDLPVEVDRIILRCLRKDASKRFQSMRELKLALEDILEHPTSINSNAAALPAAPKKRGRWAAAAALAVVLATAAVWWRWPKGEPVVGETKLIRLTSDSGLSTDPAISEDGKLLAYASDRSGEGNLDIWLQQVGGAEPIRITHGPGDNTQPDFAPDATQIVFRAERQGGGIYLVSSLGGDERKIADGGYRPRFSPDGKSIAYWTGSALNGPSKLWVIEAAGGPARQVQPQFAAASWPVWSPDGKSLLFLGKSGSERVGWWLSPVREGTPMQIQPPAGSEQAINGWFPYAWRGGRVVFSSNKFGRGSGGAQILEANLALGAERILSAPHRLTSGITTEDSPSVAADGSLVFASLATNVDVYMAPLVAAAAKATGKLERLTRDIGDDSFPSISPDGTRLVFTSSRSAGSGIWTKVLASGRETLLVKGGDGHLSPDGSTVAWDANGTVLTLPFTGGETRTICRDCGSVNGWSPDGSKLLFTDYSPRNLLLVLDIATGQKTLLAHKGRIYLRSCSPDGRWIVASAGDGNQLLVAPFRVSEPLTASDWTPITDGSHRDTWPTWAADGNLLYFTSDRDGYFCIWAVPVDGRTGRPAGNPAAVLHLHGTLRMPVNWRHLSAARDKLVFSLEERTGNIWMLKTGRH